MERGWFTEDYDASTVERPPGAGVWGGALLALATIAALLWPGMLERLTAMRPVAVLAAPDDLPTNTEDDPMRFLIERDRVELRVTQATTLEDFLEHNRLNKPHQRKAIVDALGSSAPQTPIAAGTTFHLSLTPSAPDVPGTTASRAKR